MSDIADSYASGELLGIPRTGAHVDESSFSWGAVVTIGWPSDVVRHPLLPDIIREAAGRICATSSEPDSITISFGAGGDDLEEARHDAQHTVASVLGRLGFGQDAILDGRIIPDEVVDQASGLDRHLTLVPE